MNTWNKLKGLRKHFIWCVTYIRTISNDGSLFVPQMDEDAMASMLADFVACPPDDEDGASGSNQSWAVVNLDWCDWRYDGH